MADKVLDEAAVDEAAALGADCLVIVAGGLPAGSKDIGAAREMVRDGLAAMLPHARAAGVKVAIGSKLSDTAGARRLVSPAANAGDSTRPAAASAATDLARPERLTCTSALLVTEWI